MIKIKVRLVDLNAPEDDTECESFTFISIDSLLIYENKGSASMFRQLCL